MYTTAGWVIEEILIIWSIPDIIQLGRHTAGIRCEQLTCVYYKLNSLVYFWVVKHFKCKNLNEFYYKHLKKSLENIGALFVNLNLF